MRRVFPPSCFRPEKKGFPVTDSSPGPLILRNANFKLSSRGETVRPFDTIENGHPLLDSVTVEAPAGDQSCGRRPDDIGFMLILSTPMPGGPNAEPPAAEGN